MVFDVLLYLLAGLLTAALVLLPLKWLVERRRRAAGRRKMRRTYYLRRRLLDDVPEWKRIGSNAS